MGDLVAEHILVTTGSRPWGPVRLLQASEEPVGNDRGARFLERDHLCVDLEGALQIYLPIQCVEKVEKVGYVCFDDRFLGPRRNQQ
jgi:hypothetical protein